jgi:hypothetical protein
MAPSSASGGVKQTCDWLSQCFLVRMSMQYTGIFGELKISLAWMMFCFLVIVWSGAFFAHMRFDDASQHVPMHVHLMIDHVLTSHRKTFLSAHDYLRALALERDSNFYSLTVWKRGMFRSSRICASLPMTNYPHILCRYSPHDLRLQTDYVSAHFQRIVSILDGKKKTTTATSCFWFLANTYIHTRTE